MLSIYDTQLNLIQNLQVEQLASYENGLHSKKVNENLIFFVCSYLYLLIQNHKFEVTLSIFTCIQRPHSSSDEIKKHSISIRACLRQVSFYYNLSFFCPHQLLEVEPLMCANSIKHKPL